MVYFIDVIVLIICVICVILIYLKRVAILSFLFPNQWALVTMVESDNSVSTWIQRKASDLRFVFNEGLYNMYEKRIDGGSYDTVIYRSGRLVHYFYVEGNENPIDLRTLKTTGNPQMDLQKLRVDISKMFIRPSPSLLDLLRQYWPYILAIGIAIVILRFIQKGG